MVNELSPIAAPAFETELLFEVVSSLVEHPLVLFVRLELLEPFVLKVEYEALDESVEVVEVE